MYEWLAESFGDQTAVVVYYAIIFVAILLGLWLLRIIWRGMNGGTFVNGGNNRKHRLAIIDATAVDNRRRLVLVRRDDVEHLVLIGGMNDVVIERDIQPANQKLNETTPDARPAAAITPEPAATPKPAREPETEEIIRKPMAASTAAAAGAVGGIVAANVSEVHSDTQMPKPEPALAPVPEAPETAAVAENTEIEVASVDDLPASQSAVEAPHPVEAEPVVANEPAPVVDIDDYDNNVQKIEPIAINEPGYSADDHDGPGLDDIEIESASTGEMSAYQAPVEDTPSVDAEPFGIGEAAPVVNIDDHGGKVPEIEPIALNESPIPPHGQNADMDMEIEMTPEQLSPRVEPALSSEADIEDEMEDLLNQLTGSAQN